MSHWEAEGKVIVRIKTVIQVTMPGISPNSTSSYQVDSSRVTCAVDVCIFIGRRMGKGYDMYVLVLHLEDLSLSYEVQSNCLLKREPGHYRVNASSLGKLLVGPRNRISYSS